jgi:hypothetical protein
MRLILITSLLVLAACGRHSHYNTLTREVVSIPSDSSIDRGLGFYDACLALTHKSSEACSDASEKYVEDLRERMQ